MPLQEAAEAFRKARVEEDRARAIMNYARNEFEDAQRTHDRACDDTGKARRALIEAAEVDE